MAHACHTNECHTLHQSLGPHLMTPDPMQLIANGLKSAFDMLDTTGIVGKDVDGYASRTRMAPMTPRD